MDADDGGQIAFSRVLEAASKLMILANTRIVILQ
jgi:hypothetical protein